MNGTGAWGAAIAGVVACALCVPCLAQGGQGGGGFGGGGLGGGMGGMAGGTANETGDSFSRMHILTPGEHGEWPLKVEAGETVIARASSTAFDPYIQVVNAEGKEVSANDDIRPGEQDALVRVTFAKAGEYKILVKAFKSAGGGQYKFTLRRFTAVPVSFSTRTPGTAGRKSFKWYQFVAEKGQTLVVTVRSSTSSTATELVAPNGETVDTSPQRIVGGRGQRFDFKASEKGSYFLRVSANGRAGEGFALTVTPARTLAIKVGDTSAATKISAGGLDIWTFSGTPGEVIRVDAHSAAATISQTIDYAGSADAQAVEKDPAPPIMYLPYSEKMPEVGIALLGRKGQYTVSVSQPLGLETTYTVSISRPVRPWNAGDVNASLPVGASEYWSIAGKPGQIVRLEGDAEPFDIDLNLYSPRGDVVASNDDGAGGRNALLTVLLTEAGTYLVRVHSSGDGGGGAYRLRRAADPVRPIRTSDKLEGTVGVGVTDIWSFSGRAGQSIILSVRSADFDTSVRLYGPDGVEVASDDDGGDGTNSLLSTQLPVTGTYTIWMTPKLGSGKYTIRLLDAD